MTEVGVNGESDERNENSSGSDDPETQEKESNVMNIVRAYEDLSGSDDPETQEKEPNVMNIVRAYSTTDNIQRNDYEKQRDLRVSRNKAKMEALGLQGIANSLVDLGQKKGKGITQLRRSKRVSKNSKDDADYEPNNDDDDDGDGLNDSSEELEDEGSGKKKKKSNKKKKKKVGNECETMVVDVPPKVLIPDSSLQFTGFCQETIHLVFPKAPEDEVKKLMDCFPKGFNGFNHEQGERALRWIAGLKDDYWILRRSEVEYPEFREEGVEGLPLPEGFKGFNLEESKQISEVIVTLEAAYSRLRDYFDEAKNRITRSNTRKSLQKYANTADLMDEDEALKQAIALSLRDSGETSDQQHGRSNEHSREDIMRKKKSFKSRVQMTEDDLVIKFCQFDEVGKGSIKLRDLQQMAASHDFTWTDNELADMIRCFDSDRDGKLTLDDFRSIVLRCNMLQIPENH